MNLTPEQQTCIDVVDRDLIVSAGAGAGKTATLIERLYSLLASTDSSCSLDEILVVTFTRAAAEEMRSRLAGRLRAAVTDDSLPSALRDHLEEQLFLLPRAPISTLHSFCLSLISAYPEEVGLAPGFDLMSEEEARLFRRDFFEEKIEETLESPEPIGAALRRLLEEADPVAGAASIQSDLLGLLAFLDSLPYPEKYIDKCLELLVPGEEPLADSPLGRLLSRHVSEWLRDLLGNLEQGLSFDPQYLNENLAPQWTWLYAKAEDIKDYLARGAPLDELDTIIEECKFPRLSSRKVPVSEQDEAFREVRDDLNGIVKKAAEALVPFLPENLEADAYSCAFLLKTLLHEAGIGWGRELFDRHLAARRLTFSHLERLAVRILRGEDEALTDIARLYRDKFRFVLVDEFQDINDVQDLIIRSISRGQSGDCGGNLFAVGDVKQSIYEFRLADPTLFLDTYHAAADYSDAMAPGVAARINLGRNFRSAWLLLEEFNQLFSLLLREKTIGLEYSPHHAFSPGRGEKQNEARPPVYTMHILSKEIEGGDSEEGEDLSAEAQYVANLVASIGPPWRDICILLRSAAGKATELVESLSRLDIPTFSDSRAGFLTAVEVLELQAILRCIYNPYDDIALLSVLRGPAFRWNEDELLELRGVDRSAFFIDNLEAMARTGNSGLSSRAAVFLETLARWQRESAHQSMADLITLLFDELHLLDRAAVRPGGDQRRLNLVYMHDRARQFDRFLTKGLGAFLQFIEDLIENDEDFSPPSPLPAGADVVRIMTIHKSKGQQFPIVITPYLGTKFNETGLNSKFLFDRHTGGATKIRDVASELDCNPPLYEAIRSIRRRNERGEELRLLYVAQTRAREAVYMVGTSKDPEKKLDQAASRARNPLPSPAEVLSANCPLDWIYMLLPRRFDTFERGDDAIRARDGIASLHIAKSSEAVYTDAVAGKREEPMESPGAETIAAFQQAMGRIQRLAERAEPPRIRAKISVTEAKRAFDSTRDPETPPFRLPSGANVESIDWLPEALKPRIDKRGGAERGQAIHRFLALCDLERLSRVETRLSEELERMQTEHLLSPEHAALVNLHDIAWFLNSDLGKRLRGAAGPLHRERAFTIRIDSDELAGTDSSEPVVLQGVIDLLFQGEGEGWVIIDYKTDYCGENGERVAGLVEGYTPQLQLYRLLVERTLGDRVKDAWLVFLNGRKAVRVAEAAPGEIPWHKVVEAGAVIHADSERRVVNPRGV